MSHGALHIRDSRTSREYEIPIRRNTVLATDLKQIKASPVGADRADKVGDGLRVFDPGLKNTCVVETNMTYTDGHRGLLLFRGYALEQLWQAEFEDMLHLLVWGKYPTPSQREALRLTLATLMSTTPKHVAEVIETFPPTSPPMPMIVAGLSAYLAHHADSIPACAGGNIYHGNPEQTDRAILRTAAAYAVVMGMAASHRRGIAFTPATTDNTYFENLFIMMGLVEPYTGRPDPVKLSCFRRFAALNSEHGMALSSFAMVVTASSLTDPISGLISSLVAAYGPLHFGAPEAEYKTIQAVGSVDQVPAFLEEVKSGKRRLFGYGHRTYTTIDPRVKPIKDMLFSELDGDSDPLVKVAREIDRLSSTDEYFIKRKLHANADFYGTFFFNRLGFQPEEIPVAMVAQRLVGILAHYRESMLKNKIRLFRPTHVYTGETEPVLEMTAPSAKL
uniref:Citrate synthase n=1 Tax=Paecilomyces divaricatus TaxID=644132 RepID=A0A3G1IHJ3_PAEDI|nr:citrate synthase-like protein [Paecilomyces divaricatus]